MIIWWYRGVARTAAGQEIGTMSLSEAATLAADYGTEIGSLVFVRIGLPPA